MYCLCSPSPPHPGHPPSAQHYHPAHPALPLMWPSAALPVQPHYVLNQQPSMNYQTFSIPPQQPASASRSTLRNRVDHNARLMEHSSKSTTEDPIIILLLLSPLLLKLVLPVAWRT